MINPQPLPPHVLEALKQASTLMAQNKTVIESMQRLQQRGFTPAFADTSLNLDLARFTSDLPGVKSFDSIARDFAERIAPLFESQVRPILESQQWSDLHDRMRPIVRAAYDNLEHGAEAQLAPGDIEMIEELLSDADLSELIDNDTMNQWSALTLTQKRWVSRGVGLILNAFGAVGLTLIGLPWLAAVLGVAVNTVTEYISGKIEGDG